MTDKETGVGLTLYQAEASEKLAELKVPHARCLTKAINTLQEIMAAFELLTAKPSST